MRASRAKVAGLHDTATTTGTADAASARACASAPWRGGSNTTQSNGFSSAASSGRRNRSRASTATGFRPCVVSAARLSAAIASLSLSTAVMRARSASRSANGPTPANRSAILLGLAAMLQHQRRQRGFAGRGRLQEGARRQRDPRAAHRHGRRRALHDDLAMAREPRQPVLRRRRAPAPWSPPSSAVPSRARRHRGRSRSRSPGCRAACACVSIVSAIAQAAAIAPSSAGARTGQRSMATI